MSGDRARELDDAHAPTRRAESTLTDDGEPKTPAVQRDSLPPILATRYELKRVIGAGGMGLVYEALDLNLHRLVALKVLKLAPTKPEERAEAVSRLVREARAMAALTHRNVVTVYDVDYHEDQVFMAMQLVDGNNLRQWMQAQKRSQLQILEVLREAGSGLAAAHEVRLVHRDFKPDNVLISQRGSVRVTDFGLARRSDGLIEALGVTTDRVSAPGVVEGDVNVTSVTRSGAIVGTPAYMAPEQASGNPCDARADQFSFCVTAWEALYGGRPFSGKNWSEIYSSVQRQAFVLPPIDRRVPRQIQKALRRGLSVDPNDRFASMDELLAVFDDALRIPIRRRRAVLAGAAVLAIVAAVIISRNVGTKSEQPPQVVANEPIPSPQLPQSGSWPGMSPEKRMQHAIRKKPVEEDVAAVSPEPPKPTPKPPRSATAKVETAPPSVDPSPLPSPSVEPPKPPPPDPRLEPLKAARATLDSEYQRRELLASDMPAEYTAAVQSFDEAMTAGSADRATEWLAKARAVISGIQIDRKFVDNKMQRVNARIGKLPKERQAELTALLTEVSSLFNNDQFVAANHKINEIVKKLGR